MLRVQKGGLIRKVLADHAAALRAKSTPDATIRDVLSVLSSQEARSRIIKPQTLDGVAGSKPQGHAG
ncbi:hypothetical protein PT277_02330 [Acetobacteraceae bacterium ESL0709]|nr:hypothetical protein [Acetobacteraceae bacterium ESL0709]